MNTIIEPNKFYTPKEIAELKLFPWIEHEKTIRQFIAQDAKGRDILKAIVKKGATDNGTRYFIRGTHIIKLLAKFEDGSLFDGR